MIVLIDSGVLGKLCNPNSSTEVAAARERLYALLAKGVYVVSSQICDYEVRRSLVLNSMRGLSSEGINNLNKLAEFINFLPVSNTVLQVAASLWAEARIQGREYPQQTIKALMRTSSSALSTRY